MKYTVILAVCILCACFAINSAKTGFDTVKQAKNQQNQVIAMLDK
jgi:hypothetical protein